MKYRLLRLSLLSMLVMLFGGFSLAAILNASDEGPNYDKFQDFEAIVNNQEGTLLTSEEQVQGTAVEFGIAVNDEGKTLRVATNDPDAFATISGNYHSEHGLTNMKVTVHVNSFVEILVGQCTYSSAPIKVTNSYGVEVASATPATACWKNDHNNITKLIYSGADTGAETTLTITGMQYCPYIAVKVHHPVAERSEFRNFAAIVNNQEGTMLTAEEQVQGKAVILNIAVDDDGNTIRETDPNGSYHHVATITGNYHSEHGLTNMVCAISQPPVTGKLRILVGQCTYSSTPIKVTDLLEQELASVTPATACWKNDHNNVTEIICNSSEFPITITGMQYCPFIAVEKYEEPVEPTFPITATWDFANADVANAAAALSGITGTLESNGLKLYIDATGQTIRNNGNSIQTGNPVIFRVPVQGKKDVVTVVGYPGYFAYSIAGVDATEATTTYTATAADVAQGYVEIVNKGQYLISISVTQNEDDTPVEPTLPITATWDFANADVANAAAALSGITGTLESNGLKLYIDATGQTIRNNGNSIQTGNPVIFRVPVQGKKDVVTVVGYPGYFAYSIAGVDATEATTTYTATAADVAQGYVEIVNKGQYLISISVTQNEDEGGEDPVEQDITGTWDYSDADIMAATMAFSGSSEVGEVEAKEKNGLKMTVVANGVTFRNNGNNIQVRSGAVFKIPIKNAGDLITVKGYPNYSKYTIGNSTEVLTNENSYKAKASDAQAGYVAVTSMDDNNYYLSLSVTQYAPKEATTLDNEPVIATFPFNLGTEGQTATFSNADYFLNSKVTIGSNLSIKDKSTLTDAETGAQVDQTRLQPTTKLDTPDEASAVRFTITPKPGFAFTPTKVSLNVTRYGTDNGLADVTWEVAGGENIVLATGVKPERNNKNPNISKLSYNIENATAAEGAATLLLHLYSLQDGKQFGLNDIAIEGTLSGTEKELPILASFKVNGIEYAAEDVFGDLFEATLKLSKKDNMVSAENPLTDVIATNGEIGTITYEGDETACKVTIPMTAGDVQQNYVLNVIQKPDYTLSYIGVDGTTVIDTQVREEDQPIGEFAVDIATVAATKDGYKARGWFMQSYLGEKFTTDYVVTGDTKLYAVQTEVEGPSDSRKYIFNLTDKFFYAEDHEAFNPTGGVWHDKQHGWVFANGDQIELLVGKKANINFTFCQYSAADATISSSDGQSISAVTEGACGAGTLAYEGEEGKLTLTINASGSVYIHDITIFNTTTTNYDKQGDWLIVKQGDASSFLDAIEAAKGIEGAKVFLPNGTYDLGETVKTSVSGTNVSIIGQSAENTIVVNRPPLEWEGLDKADLLKTSATGLYMQDLSLKNDLPYTGNNGRAASLHDVGTQTICKNVNLLSYQDTYYSNKTGGLFYFEGGELHGTVDYLCGDGRVYFNECKMINEKRSTATISANSELYVFNNCVVENNADKYNLGRAWSNNPVCVYLNTTLLAPGKLLDTRWNPSGINCDYSVAGEYGTKNAEGTDITPASNVVTFTKNNTTLETILNAEQAATYTMEYVLGDWAATAKQETKQLEAPAAEFANSTVTWTPANDGAIAYMIEKNGEFVGITAGSSMAVEANAESDKLTIRAANARGGFGEAKQVAYTGTSIQAINAAIERGEQVIFNLAGQRVNKATKGMYIINGKKMVVK